MDPITIAAIIAAGASIIGAGVSYVNSKNTNSQNASINQKNFDYNTAMTQQSWERDDSYYQRSIEDLQNAGLSPLALSGSMPSSAALGAPSPIAMQAPQLDTNGVVNALLQSAQLKETERHDKATEDYQSGVLANQTEEIKLKTAELNLEDNKLQQQIKYQSDLIELQNNQLDEVIRHNKKGEEVQLSELEQRQLEHQTEAFYKEVNAMAGGADVPRNVIKDFSVWQSQWNLYVLKYNSFLDKIGATSSASATSKTRGGNASGSAVGTGLGIGANASDSSYSSENLSQKQEELIRQFRLENPIPVYIPDGKYDKVKY